MVRGSTGIMTVLGLSLAKTKIMLFGPFKCKDSDLASVKVERRELRWTKVESLQGT